MKIPAWIDKMYKNIHRMQVFEKPLLGQKGTIPNVDITRRNLC